MPKTYNNLYPQICKFNNIHLAYIKARRNKRYRPDVLKFTANLEQNLYDVQQKMLDKTYQTGNYRMFYVYEPKKRIIMALPFKDRIVHHAICNIIEPIFDSIFIYDSYACRKNKGIHEGSNRLTYFLRQAHKKWDIVYFLKCDVKQYFQNINHDVLFNILNRHIKCKSTLNLLENIIRSHNKNERKGIPIGNLTSQLFANIYLNELDYFVKHGLKIKYYLRYMDDFIILSDDKKYLHKIKTKIEDYLLNTLYLKLNYKSNIGQAKEGIDFLGYRTWFDHKIIRKSSIKRIRKRIKRSIKDNIPYNRIKNMITSWFGYCSHADTYRLKEKTFLLFPQLYKLTNLNK